MRKKIFLLFVFLLLFFPNLALAVENPLAVANNKFGIHILFPDEIIDSVKIINSTGGDWGYVTIPIQSGDRNLVKWQKFMDNARKFHVIPLIRLATEGDYFNTKVWRKPTQQDVLDFANFLNSLYWPTKNHYIIVFNEPNRGDEWGGIPNPGEYAAILSYTTKTFKEKNKDFFIISAGLDNAAQNGNASYNQYDFLREMNAQVNGIFTQIDGLGSHSYPNPGFSQNPYVDSYTSITSFKYEKNLVKSLSGKDLPVFITETGWSKERLSTTQIAQYYKKAFESVWSDQNIVAVTPFIFRAGSPPFDTFSFIDNGAETEFNKSVQSLPKIKGTPLLDSTSPATVSAVLGEETLVVKNFKETNNNNLLPNISPAIKAFIRWFLNI
ncbi:MAG: hypothetical protein Q8P80_04260 [Candidatus Levybacteria bacterium]|nr:hypothetical protein [Candidatus Levybacteria bacterium]